MEKRVFTTREITRATGLTEREAEEAIKRLSCNSEVTTIQHKGFNAGIYGSEPAPVVIEQIFNIKSTEYRHYSVNTTELLKLADYVPRPASVKLRQLYDPEPPGHLSRQRYTTRDNTYPSAISQSSIIGS